MIDVIIVDDEPLIRDGLVKLFSWKDYQMQVSAVFPLSLIHISEPTRP